MGKIAFVFSGQGDQYPGMGEEMYKKYSSAREIFDMCDEIRPGTTKQCFFGTDDELKETVNTQPCLFAMELAAAKVLLDKKIVPEAVAGFSLGEVTAATFSGMFDYETGFKLVCKRGELMQQEAEKYDTFMAAVIKLTAEQVEEICKKYSYVYPVNFNCPGQVTVSGLAGQKSDFFAEVKAAGGRAIPLKLKGAFHSPYMNAAAKYFAEELSSAELSYGKIPLYSNLTSELYDGDAAGLLAQQICNPVQWEKIIRNMISSGFDTFIEIGPGSTLTNMIKKIDAGVKALNFEDYLAEIEGCIEVC